LTQAEEDFAKASVAEATHGRRIRRAIIASMFLILSSGLVQLYRADRRASGSARVSQDRLAALYEEQGRQMLLADDPMRAMPYLAEAYRGGRNSPVIRFLIGRASRILGARLMVLKGHGGSPLFAASFSSDGRSVLTGGDDGSAQIWDTESGQAIATLEGHKDTVWTARISPKGTAILTCDRGGSARIWRWNGRVVSLIGVLAGRFGEFSPDGSRVVTASADGTTRLWDVATGQLQVTMAGHSGGVTVPAFSPDGTRLVTAGRDGVARLWNAASGELGAPFRGPHGAVSGVALRPDGARLLTAGDDRTAGVWSVATGRPELVLRGHTAVVITASFSASGAVILTAAGDRTAKLWDARTGASLVSMIGHSGRISTASLT